MNENDNKNAAISAENEAQSKLPAYEPPRLTVMNEDEVLSAFQVPWFDLPGRSPRVGPRAKRQAFPMVSCSFRSSSLLRASRSFRVRLVSDCGCEFGN